MAPSKNRESDERGKVFVLQNIPADYDSDLIIDHIEGTLDIGVKEVQLHPFVPERALVFLDERLKDFPEAKKKIRKGCPDFKKVNLLVASREPAVVVSDLDTNKLSAEFLCLYFECEFADGNEVIKNSETWPELNMAVVHFYPSTKAVVDNILESSDRVPLPSEDYHITIQPFYDSFHTYIEQPEKQNKGSKTTAVEKEFFLVNNIDKKAKKEGRIETAKRDTDEEDDSEMEEDESEEEMPDVQVSKGDKNEQERKSKKHYVEDETSSSEQSDVEKEDINAKSVKNKKSVGRTEKDKTPSSKKETLTTRSGFIGRGMGRRGTGSSRSASYGKTRAESKDNKDNSYTSSKNRMSSPDDKQHFPYEDEELQNRYERQHKGRDNKRSEKKVKGDLPSHFENHNPCGSSSNDERLSESNSVKKSARQSNYRGRGGTTFVPAGARNAPATYIPNDRHYMPENEDFRDCFPAQFNQNFSNLKSYLYHLGGPEHTNIRQASPEENSTFHTAQQENEDKSEYNKKIKSEIAAKVAKIKQLEKELANKNEKIQPYIVKVPMATWQKEFLSDCFGNFTDCTVKFDPHENVAILEGKSENVNEHQLKLLMELKKLKEELLVLSPAMVNILSKEQGKKYLHELNSKPPNETKTFLQNGSLMVAAKDDKSLQSTIDFLKNRINYNTIHKMNAKLSTEKQHYEKSMLESMFLVQISWQDTDLSINIEGIKDDVFEVVRHLSKLEEEHGFHEKSFNVTGPLTKFFHGNLEDKIRNYLSSVEKVAYTFTEAQISITFKGDRKTVTEVHKKLTELKKKVTTKTWDLSKEFKNPVDLMLITKGSCSEKFKKKIKNFEETKRCLITITLPKVTFTVGASKKKQKSIHSPKQKRQLKAAAPQHVDAKLIFDLPNACKLVIKPYGDITKELSDVLVCLLTKNVDLRKTRVGLAFNKMCPNLWKILQAEHDAHPNDTVLTTRGPVDPLKCKDICHIILNPWDPNTSPNLLSQSIQLVVSQAVALGATSISFPVLGCGRAFGFPASEVAQITLAAIKKSSLGTITKIVLLAPDIELYKEFKLEAPKHFQAVPATVQGAAAMASPDETDAKVTDADDGSDESEESEEDEKKISFDKEDKPEISIVALHDSGKEDLWPRLKEEIIKVCIYTKYYNQEISNFWPKTTKDTIHQEAKKLGVWVEKSPNPKTKKPGYIVKGTKKNVEAVYGIIHKEFEEFSSHLPKQRMKSDKAPKRGTPEFIKYAVNSDELFPSYWNLNSSKTFHKSLWNKFKDNFVSSKPNNRFLVDVDAKTLDAIKSLVAKTWNPQYVGHGADAQGLSHRGIKIIDVKRIENVNLFELYSVNRKAIFRKKVRDNSLCQDIGHLRDSKGRIQTTEHLEKFMKDELYYEINEHYLFHGTKCPDAIVSNGIDPKVSSEGGMFGRGIYLAESFTKSDQYTDSRSLRSQPGQKLTMILARVLLGHVFVCDDKHKSVQSKQSVKLSRPPCISCLQDKCGCPDQTLFDSVMGEGKWIFREFVVYDLANCYPEYLIYYQRV